MQQTESKITAFLDRWVFLSLLVFLAALSFSTALMEISFVSALVAWVLLKVKRFGPFPFERKAFGALSVYVLLSCASFFWSDFPAQSFRGIFKVLQHFLLFWMTADSFQVDSRRHETSWRVLIGIFIFLALNGSWQYVFGQDFIRHFSYKAASSGPRISASFSNYGLLASFLVTYWPLVTLRLFEISVKKHLLIAIQGSVASAFGLLLLFWTRLRGAWLAFVGGLVFLLGSQRKWLYLALVLAMLPVGFLLLPHSIVIHLDAEQKEQSLIERFYLWDRSLQVIAARPWTGTGINTYAVAHQKYDKTQNWRVRNYYAHNGYLQIASETGLPSLIFFLLFLFFYFRRILVQLQESRGRGSEPWALWGVLTGMANFLILGFFDTGFHNPQAIMGFWFLAGWSAGYQRILRD